MSSLLSTSCRPVDVPRLKTRNSNTPPSIGQKEPVPDTEADAHRSPSPVAPANSAPSLRHQHQQVFCPLPGLTGPSAPRCAPLWLCCQVCSISSYLSTLSTNSTSKKDLPVVKWRMSLKMAQHWIILMHYHAERYRVQVDPTGVLSKTPEELVYSGSANRGLRKVPVHRGVPTLL